MDFPKCGPQPGDGPLEARDATKILEEEYNRLVWELEFSDQKARMLEREVLKTERERVALKKQRKEIQAGLRSWTRKFRTDDTFAERAVEITSFEVISSDEEKTEDEGKTKDED